MKKKSLPSKIILPCLILAAFTLAFLNPSIPIVHAEDNEPQVREIGADDDLVNIAGDNINITFEVENYNPLESVEMYIRDSEGVQRYESWGDNLERKEEESGQYLQVFTLGYNPNEDFEPGPADVEVFVEDNEGLTDSFRENYLFQVTDISIETRSAVDITKDSATLRASIDLDGHDQVEARFYYDNDTVGDWDNTGWESTSTSDYEKTITGLDTNENYVFKASVRLPDGVGDIENGEVREFTTMTDKKPSVRTKENAENVEYVSAAIQGELEKLNWKSADVWFQLRENGDDWEKVGERTLSNPDNFSETLTDLEDNTVYEFRAVATNPAGENKGEIENFETKNAENLTEDNLPSVVTKEADKVDYDSAIIRGELTSINFEGENANVWFQFRKSGGDWEKKGERTLSAPDNFYYTLTGLESGVAYDFRAVASNPAGVNEGGIRSFDTDDNMPSVVTGEADKVDYDSAVIRGELVSINFEGENANVWFQLRENGGGWENVGERTLSEPGTFSETLTGLESGVSYDFRAVASNPAGVNEGGIRSFDTDDNMPSVVTGEADKVDYDSAVIRGELVSINFEGENANVWFQLRENGGGWENVGERTLSEPGTFSETLTGLESGVSYDFRAVASNPVGEDTGSIESFETLGSVDIHEDYPSSVQVNGEGSINFTIYNYYQEKELRDVVIEVVEERPDDDFRAFESTYHTVGTIQPDTSGSEEIIYQPVNSGEKELEFTVSYRVYSPDNDFLYEEERNIEIPILVTGTEYDTAIDLQVSTEMSPREWIFDGETYTAQIAVHNQRPTEVTGVRVLNEKGRDIGVGTLAPDETQVITVKVPPKNYQVGENNQVSLQAEHELGVSPPLELEFGVRPENAPVDVYLTETNSPIYEGKKLEFTLLVAGSANSQVKDLTINCLSENVLPEGYWIGEEMKNLSEQPVSTQEVTEQVGMEALIGGALPGGVESGEGEEEKEKSIIGRKIYFEGKNLDHDSETLRFEMEYELGDRLVREEFEVDYHVRGTPEIMLIQTDPVEAVEGSTTTVSLEIANEMGIEAKAVRVEPTGNVDAEISPRPAYWIGPMGSEEFLPVEFSVDTSDLEDGDNLEFRPVYRIGDRKVKGSPLSVTVNIEESDEAPVKYYAAASGLVVVVLLLLFWYRRK